MEGGREGGRQSEGGGRERKEGKGEWGKWEDMSWETEI